MAQASEEELTQQQPGAAPQTQPSPQEEKDKELEKLKKLLAEKDAQITEMKEKLKETPNQNDDNTTSGNDEQETKMPPKTDVTLSLRGIPEYDQYPFTMQAERFYFMASVKAPYFRTEQRAPIDLIAVVDESGSMSGDRIKLVKETMKFVIKNLESGDRFGIVGYSSGSRIVLPLTKMDDNGKKKALSLSDELRASGGTALCAGLVEGVNMMRQRKYKNDVASVMILTDGQANQGPRNAAGINAAVRTGKISNINTSSYGHYGGPPPPPMMQQQMYQNRNVPIQRNKKMAKKKRIQNKLPTKKMASKPMRKQQINISSQGVPPPPIPPQQIFQQQQVQQVQQQGIVPTIPRKDMIEDEKEKEGNTNDAELPCTINTFGFGSGHNEGLLESIAEFGRGMYAFIENTSMIADTFAECLGGLVSIIGQDLKIQVEALNDIEINKCLSTGYKLSICKPHKIHKISINNLQSEENRDLIFELKVPKLLNKKEESPIIQLSVSYKNVVKEREETLSSICSINRIDGEEIGERNMELDIQYNRVLAAEAMDKADELANNGKLDEARKVLTTAQQQIKTSKSNEKMFSKNLVSDIQRVQSNMQSRQQYRATGGKMLKMNKKAHKMQRSVQSSQYKSQSSYQNRSKSRMQSKFKSSK